MRTTMVNLMEHGQMRQVPTTTGKPCKRKQQQLPAKTSPKAASPHRHRNARNARPLQRLNSSSWKRNFAFQIISHACDDMKSLCHWS